MLDAPEVTGQGGQLRSVLDDHELDERGGVEVEDQRRCSATKSETGPRAVTSARRALHGDEGRGDEAAPLQVHN